MELSGVRVSLWGELGPKELVQNVYVISKNSLSKTDIPAKTLIVYSCISVKYENYNAGTDDYLGVRLSVNGEVVNCSPLCSEGMCGK